MKKLSRLLAALLALTLLALSLCACGASESKSVDNAAAVTYATTAAETPAEMKFETEEAAAEAVDMEFSDSAFSTATEITKSGAADTSTQDVSSKIIYSADLIAQTTDFDAAISALEQQIVTFGGFIERSDVNGDTNYDENGVASIVNRWACYVIRVPSGRFEDFLHQTEGLGNVTSLSRYAENVTSQYTDYEARLSSLRTQEERLLSMLEKSEDVDSLIALEERLSDVRYELESIERSLKNLDMQISYSTVTLNLEEVEIYTPTAPVQRTFGEKLSDAFSTGWRRFVRNVQYFCIDLVTMLPGIVLFALLVLVGIFVVRKVLRRQKSRREKKAAPKTSAQQDPQTPDEK